MYQQCDQFDNVPRFKLPGDSLQLVDTKKHAYDYKDKLLERDLGFDTAPVAFEIVAYCSDESDQIVCGRVASKLTEMHPIREVGRLTLENHSSRLRRPGGR